jgi:predicted nucleic acid-binding Zn ribbon protein
VFWNDSCVNHFQRLESRRMPTYVYEELKSGTRFEVEQRITEAPLTHNPETGEAVKRIIFASAVVFKGSGFYKNDSRAPEPGGKSDSSKSDSGKAEAKSDAGKTDSSKSDSSKPDSGSTKTESSSAPAATPSAPKSASTD